MKPNISPIKVYIQSYIEAGIDTRNISIIVIIVIIIIIIIIIICSWYSKL